MESMKMIALLLLAVITIAEGKKCPEKYARFSTMHSYCRDPNPKCKIVKEGVDQDAINTILKIHNNLRSKVATGKETDAGGLPSASNMMQLTWNDELAVVAQCHADQCNADHDCNPCRSVEDFSVGQNLGVEDISEKDIKKCKSDDCIQKWAKPNWEKIINQFYAEVKVFNKTLIKPYLFASVFGHFSQLVWAKSWNIGCGYVSYYKDKGLRRLYICNYGPAGNTNNEAMYEPGEPCSACPSNTCCGNCKTQDPTYPGLCRVMDESKGPVYKAGKDALIDCNWRNGSSSCPFNIVGKDDWTVKSSRGGPYITMRMKNGEASNLELTTDIKPNSPNFCIVLEVRRGPADAADEDSSEIDLALEIPDYDFNTQMPLQSSSYDFQSYPMNIGWGEETKIALDNSVGSNAKEHIFDIKEIIAYDGNCDLS